MPLSCVKRPPTMSLDASFVRVSASTTVSASATKAVFWPFVADTAARYFRAAPLTLWKVPPRYTVSFEALTVRVWLPMMGRKAGMILPVAVLNAAAR